MTVAALLPDACVSRAINACRRARSQRGDGADLAMSDCAPQATARNRLQAAQLVTTAKTRAHVAVALTGRLAPRTAPDQPSSCSNFATNPGAWCQGRSLRMPGQAASAPACPRLPMRPLIAVERQQHEENDRDIAARCLADRARVLSKCRCSRCCNALTKGRHR